MSAVPSCGKLIGHFSTLQSHQKLTFWCLFGNIFGGSFFDFLAIFLDDFLATYGQLVWRLYGDSFGDFMAIFLGDFTVTTWCGDFSATPLFRLFDHFLGTIWRLFWWIFAAFGPLYGYFFLNFLINLWECHLYKPPNRFMPRKWSRVLTPTVDGRSPADMVNISVCAERFIHVRWFFEISEPSTVRKAFRLGTFEDKLVP